MESIWPDDPDLRCMAVQFDLRIANIHILSFSCSFLFVPDDEHIEVLINWMRNSMVAMSFSLTSFLSLNVLSLRFEQD